MTTNHIGDGTAGFDNVYPLMTDGDPPMAALFRVPLEQVADNVKHLRDTLTDAESDTSLLTIRVTDLETCLDIDEDFSGFRVTNSDQFMAGKSGVWTNNLGGSPDTEDVFTVHSSTSAPGIMRLVLPGSGPAQVAIAYGAHDTGGLNPIGNAFRAGIFANPRSYIEFRYAAFVDPFTAADYDVRMGLFVGDVPGFGIPTKSREVQIGFSTGDGGIWSVSGPVGAPNIQPMNPVLTQPIDGEYRRVRITSGANLLDTTTVYSSTGAVIGTRVHTTGHLLATDFVYLGAWALNPGGDSFPIDIDRIRAFAMVTR